MIEYRNISRWRNIVECCSCAAAFYYFVQQNENRPKHSCVVLIWRAMTEGDFNTDDILYILLSILLSLMPHSPSGFRCSPFTPNRRPCARTATKYFHLLIHAHLFLFLFFFFLMALRCRRCGASFFFFYTYFIYRAWNILGQNIMNTYGTQRTQSTESRVLIFTQTS